MLPDQSQLTMQEETVVEILLHPYGVELSSTEIQKKAKGSILLEELPELLDHLEMKGYLKGRFVLLEGYLVKRRVYHLNHSQLFVQSRDRLRTRLILDRILKAKIPTA